MLNGPQLPGFRGGFGVLIAMVGPSWHTPTVRYANSPSKCQVCNVHVREGRTRCPTCRRIPFVCPDCGLETHAKVTGKYPEYCPVCRNACEKCGEAIVPGHRLCKECRSISVVCSRCTEAFEPKVKGKLPTNCPSCAKIKQTEVGRAGSKLKSEERRQQHLLNRESCKDCGKVLPLRKTTKYKYCSDCYPAMKTRYEEARRIRLKKNDPFFDKRRDLKKNYGISLEEYTKLFQSQKNRCAICLSNESGGKGWHVDHDHKTGVIRGILCHFCNLGLGHFKDDQQIMKTSIKYLNAWERIHGNS